MKQLTYTIRYLLRGRGGNQIKIISLTLGLGVGLILFARVAFEMSFDTFFEKVENLYIINNKLIRNGETQDASPVICAPVPGSMRDELPEIESATVCRIYYGSFSLYHDNNKYTPRTMMADSLFFRTMGIQVLRGDDRLLGTADHIFLSEKYAKRIFGNEDPIGKLLLYGKNHPYTVAGVFKDVPENSHIRFQTVASFINMKTQFGAYCGWNADDSYSGYVRMKKGVDIPSLEQKLPAWMARHMDVAQMQREGYMEEYSFMPVSEVYTKDPEVKRMVMIMSVLGFCLLFIAAMNYVLMSISSLATRAKSVGIHKCSGASSGNIFSMFMYETGIVFICALVGVSLLLLSFRESIAEVTAVPSLATLINGQTIWLPALMLGVIFLIAAVLPARLFSSVPVTQVFRVTATGKSWWKRVLLFVQFGGIAFISMLLLIVLLQYNRLMNKDLGYDPEYIVSAGLRGVEDKNTLSMLTAEFKRFSYVKAVGNAGAGITSGYGGFPVYDEDMNWLFTARRTSYDPDYLPLMGIELVAGRNLRDKGEIVVNETYVKACGWTESPIGKDVISEKEVLGKIVGVMKDFPVSSLYLPQDPVLVTGDDALLNGRFTLRLSELNPGHLRELNDKLLQLYPNEEMAFTVLKDSIEDQYESARHFRDAVTLATFAILMITLMGLFGYINDEIHRKSKEIAIRKVNGATAGSILGLLSKDILYTAFPAVLLGTLVSRFVGEGWLQQFADKIPLNLFLFIASTLVVLAIILGCVIFKSWNVANENPVKSIKSE